MKPLLKSSLKLNPSNGLSQIIVITTVNNFLVLLKSAFFLLVTCQHLSLAAFAMTISS